MRRGIIDIHAHILPGVDDGARDLEESLKMVGMAAAQGDRDHCDTPWARPKRSGDSGKKILPPPGRGAEALAGYLDCPGPGIALPGGAG